MDRLERKIISHYFKKYKNNEKYKQCSGTRDTRGTSDTLNTRGILDGYTFTLVDNCFQSGGNTNTSSSTSILEMNTDYALRIVKSIKKNDDHYGQLLVFIIGKIINTAVNCHQDINKKTGLKNAGIWDSKIPTYMRFIKQSTLKKMMPLQKKVYELDLASKGLAGITKDQFWQEIDNMVINLTTA